jgi:hypothetical protein
MKKLMRVYKFPVLVLLFLVVGLTLQTGRAHAATASLYLSPASQTVTPGSTVSVTIHENSGTDPVNAVQAKLTYPADKLTFSNISYVGNEFDVHAAQSGGGGLVLLAVGKTPPPATGDQIVATVNFLVTAGTGSASVGFGCNFSYSGCTDGNAVVRDTDNVDILSGTTGATVDINGNLDTLAPGQALTAGQSIISRNVMNMLIIQSDGNLVLYGSGRALWFSGTGGSGATKLVMQTDGNMVLYRANGTPVWWSGTGNRGASNAVLQDDGNFVIYTTPGNLPTWWTGTGGHPTPEYFGSDRLTPGQTLQAGQYMRAQDGRSAIVLQGDGNLVLYAGGYRVLWFSGTGGVGISKLIMQTDGNLVLYRVNGQPTWFSGTGGNANSTAILQTDGNFVIYNNSGTPIWFTGTGGRV